MCVCGGFLQARAWSWPQRVGAGQEEMEEVLSAQHENEKQCRELRQESFVNSPQAPSGRLGVSSCASLHPNSCPEAPSLVFKERRERD